MMKKEYKVGDVVDLDDVNISPATFARWQAIAARTGALIPPGVLVPDEQGLWLASGEMEIFVEVQIGQHRPVRISMKIPPDQWVWAEPKKRN
jgi:hypothetical protein